MLFGKNNFLVWLTEEIFGRFKTKDFSENECKYLGTRIKKEELGSTRLSTQGYEEQIKPVNISAERKKIRRRS